MNWRERVLGARALTRHAALKATAVGALSAAKDILDHIGPSEMLYQTLWGRKPSFFRRCDGVIGCRFEEASGSIWRVGQRAWRAE